MRFRYVLFLAIFTVLFSAHNASAQKKLFDVIDPNVDVFNKTVDIFHPDTETITPVGTLSVGRAGAAAVRLASGRVLIAGGQNNRYTNAAEIYDPEDGEIKETGEMMTARYGMSAVLVPGGTVHFIGGFNSDYIQTVEQYEPLSEKFMTISSRMITAREFATATVLDNDQALIAGGFNGLFLSSAEVYYPVNRVFLRTLGEMTEARSGHSAARISGGSILIAGGCNSIVIGEAICNNFLASAEAFDVNSGLFTQTAGSMAVARKDHTATVLNDGRVLIVGGVNADGVLASAEIFDPETGRFTLLNGTMSTGRVNHTATLLPDGRALIAGGESNSGVILSSMEIYNPATETFSMVAEEMSDARTQHSAVVLHDGSVLFAAGLKAPKLVFDINYQVFGDNIAGNIYFTPDSATGFTAYTGSGEVVAFSPRTGEIFNRIVTGGRPIHITPISDERLAVVSALDNKIFIINTDTREHETTYVFNNAEFGFGSQLELSPLDGLTGYISSPGSGQVIKFDVTNGNELGRISGFRMPAQITITKNGETLLVVDAIASTVKGVNAANMTLKYTFAPQDRYYPAFFSIYNRAVLNDDETMAVIGSQDAVLDGYSTAFIFNPATGEWILAKDEEGNERGGIYFVGASPGWTMLMPDGKHWLMLSQTHVSLIPTVDPRTIEDWDSISADEDPTRVYNYSYSGFPMGSSNVVLTPDSRYAFFASATTDHVIQMDLKTGGVFGLYVIGEDPNISPDQPISVALTPDSSRLVVMSYATNELSLFVESYIYRQTRYISQQDHFTGISIVNVSDAPVDIKITAMTDYGLVHIIDEDIPNPVSVSLEPNAQKSIDISELMNFDNDRANSGYLVIDSTLPVIVGYTAVGQIQGSFFSAYIRSMENVPFFSGNEEASGDLVLPEITDSEDSTTTISVVNPWYSTLVFTSIHYGTDGTKHAEQGRSLTSSARSEISSSGIATTLSSSQVLVVGGFSDYRTESNAEVFNGNLDAYNAPVSTRAARQGHTAVLLPDGNVLVAGGRAGFDIQKTAEIYRPSYNAFITTPGSMNMERYRHTATRLLDGKALIVGGQNMNSITNTAEVFDFSNGSFRYTQNCAENTETEEVAVVCTQTGMEVPREAHTATRLANGKVLITGGLDGRAITASAEIFDPETETFSSAGSMTAARAFHTATLLNDGRVLLVGGYNGAHLASAEVYDPAKETFEPVSDMSEARSSHAATMLSDGSVLITGGRNGDTDVNNTGGLNTAEVFDPDFGQFSETANTMTARRSYHTAVNFKDDQDGVNDRVIISGGFGFLNSEDTAETFDGPYTLTVSDLYTPGTRMFTRAASSLSRARQGHVAILLDETTTSGHMRLVSDMGLLASVSHSYGKGYAPASINAIDMAKYKCAETADGEEEDDAAIMECAKKKIIYSPRFVLDEDNRTTILNVINANEEVADITIALYTDDGVMIGEPKTHRMEGYGQIKGALADVTGNPAIVEKSGWIKVSSTQDQVVGTVAFLSTANKHLGVFELSVNPGLERFIFPLVTENRDYATELSFLNSGTEDAEATLELWVTEKDSGETSMVSKTVSLPAGENRYGLLSDFFEIEEMNLEAGNVRVVSDRPIHAIGEIKAKSNRYVTSVPVVEYPKIDEN